jgi:hypothetical protein
MAKDNKDAVEVKPVEPKKEAVETFDEYAKNIFQHLGHTQISSNLKKIYNDYAKRKCNLKPGRVSAEGFAFISILADIMDNKLELEIGDKNG